MTNQPRAELFEAIVKLCDRYPHWRFGQLIANIAGWSDKEIWDVDDEELLQAAREHIEWQKDREPAAKQEHCA